MMKGWYCAHNNPCLQPQCESMIPTTKMPRMARTAKIIICNGNIFGLCVGA